MSGVMRAIVYGLLGIILVVLLDPRTWGGEVDGNGDEIGIVLTAQWAASFVSAMLVLAAVVVVAETFVRSRARRRRRTGGTPSPESRVQPPTRSWYE